MSVTDTRTKNQDGAAQVIGVDNAFRYLVVPEDLNGDALHVTAAKREGLHELQTLTRKRIIVDGTESPEAIRERLRRIYNSHQSVTRNEDREASMKEFLSALLESAIAVHSSDVHLEPSENGGGRVRFRIDRVLREQKTLGREDYQSLISVLKHSAGLRIDVTREFQDGSLQLETVNARKVDARVSTIPVGQSEKAVLRLLGSYATLRRFESLGMPPGLRDKYIEVLSNPSGVHVVAGPTGSGKTTTVLAVLNTVDEGKNIVTVEDPVEARLRGAYQVEVNERSGISFSSAMRSFMRQDPDVIFCGEIRDDDTAVQTMKGGLSGRVIYSTIHAPDAIRVIDRLIEFGVRRGTIGAALRSVLAQRLVRKLCDHCKVEATVPMSLLRSYPVQFEGVRTIYERNRGGCTHCAMSGIAGQVAVFELFAMSDEIEDAIVHEASRAALYALASAEGYMPMREHAAALIAAGDTSVEEVLDVLSLSKSAA